MSTGSQSDPRVGREQKDGCVGCESRHAGEYELVLDGEQTVNLWLCGDCYEQCYERLLDAEWIEAPT